jgi:RHS repeat-associated protein
VDGLPFADAATTSLYNFYQLAPGVTLHAGESHLYAYDEQGRLTTTADAMVTTQRTFTPRGAVTSESFLFADGATVGRTYAYNRRGQRTSAVDTVSQGSTVLGAGRTDYMWNSATGRLDSMTGQRSGASYANVAYRYDLAGRDTLRLVDLHGNGGVLRVRAQYDALGRVSRLTDTSTAGVWYRFDASAAGRYDAADVLRSYTFSEPGAAGGPGSNVSGTMSMVYDSAYGTGRLLESHRDATNGPDYTWTYDVFGNRTEETCHSTWQGVCQKTEPATYGPDHTLRKRKNTELASTPVSMYWTDHAGNRLMQTDSVNGQPAASPSALLSYTALSQLFFAMTPTVQAGTYDYVWHWYDGQGRRVVTHGQQGSTWAPGTAPSLATGTRYYYVYDGSDVALVVAHAGSQWWVHQRVMSGGVDQPVAGWFYNNGGSSSGALALVSDQQGSVRAAVKPDGNRDDLAPYFGRNAWGALEGASGTGGGSTQTNTQTGYTGASSPTVTGGFTYLRNRWYDPATGRFLTQDPIGLAGGVNLYAYAGNNPVTFADPFGLKSCDPPTDPCPADRQGKILTVSLSLSAAMPSLGGFGANVEAGFALNLSSGDALAYAHAGPTLGTGPVSGGVEVAAQQGSLAETVGTTGSPASNAIETEVSLPFMRGFGGQAVQSTPGGPVVGGGFSFGFGNGLYANGTAAATSTGTVNLNVIMRPVTWLRQQINGAFVRAQGGR